MTSIGIKELEATLGELRERYSSLSSDDIFVLWFLRAYLTDQESIAEKALAGGSGDKGIDAVICDDSARCVFLIQAKNRQYLAKHDEKRDDVLGLLEKAHILCDPDDSRFRTFEKSLDHGTALLLKDARRRIQRENHRLGLLFATLGSVSKTIFEDAQAGARKVKGDVTFDVLDHRRMMLLLQDYFDGVAPPIPSLDLEMEQSPKVKVNGVAQRYDAENNIESWVFSMNGAAVAELFDRGGGRLFARNIRGFLGSTAINDGMVATLNSEADRFFYYNNGITILCDEAVQQARKGRSYLRVSNPQVINGQQTTRTLASHPDLAKNASVLVKVLVVPRAEDPKKRRNGFEKLVSKIVGGTNWQNAIRPSDLMANDRIQIELERALRKIGYAYLRKRQTKAEARSAAGGKHFRFVTKSEFAQVVAACDIDPVLARTAKEKLFSEEYYDKVFPNSDIGFYLSRYWLMRHVRSVLKSTKQSRESQWLVVHTLWTMLAPTIGKTTASQRFRAACERQDESIIRPLTKAVKQVAKAVREYYVANRRTDNEVVDVETFFKSKRASAPEFMRIWAHSSHRDVASRDTARICAAVSVAE